MNEVAQAARQFEVSIGTVYALCRPGRLAHLRIGTGRGTIRIVPEDIAGAIPERDRVVGQSLISYAKERGFRPPPMR